MNRPLEIRNVENISLEASDDNSDMYPQLVAQFTCQYGADSDCIDLPLNFRVSVCCSVVQMSNVTHAAIIGISLEARTVSAVILQQCSHLRIQSTTYISIQQIGNDSNDFVSNEYEFGIVVYECSDIAMDSLEASNFTTGVKLHNSSNTTMMNVSAAHNKHNGIIISYCTDTSMMNVSATNNKCSGIFLNYSTDTSMMNVSAAHNEQNGIYLYYSTDTSMMNVSAAHNEHSGIYLPYSTDTSMMNVFAAHNKYSGIITDYSTDTSMMNVSAAYNKYSGIITDYSTDTSVMNVSAAYNKYSGIFLSYSTDTSMMNVSAAHNEYSGIGLNTSTDTSMMNVSAANNKYSGIFLNYLNYSTDTSVMNVSAAYNGHNEMYLYYSTDTNMMNSSTVYNRNTSVYHTYSYHNMYAGMYVIGCTTTHIAYHNTGNKIYLRNNTDTYILQSVFSEHSDIEMINTANTYITNTTSFITAYNTTDIVLNETIFPNMDAPSTASRTSGPTSLPEVITLYGSTLTITNCTFTRNNISSIKAIGSNITMSGQVLFHNNTASSGTGLIFAKKSLLITTEYSNIHFQKNHARKYGGVFYIITEELYETSISLQDIIQYNGGGSLITSKTECFVNVEGSCLRLHARLTFINNTAGRGGDVLYGGLVALGYDGDWNCLLSFKNISYMSQQSGLSLISSDPSRVCLCNETGQPDCLTVADPTTRVIYPGQTITIPAVVVGQDFGTVTGSVFAQFFHTPYTTGCTTNSVDLEPRQYSIAVEHSQCSNLEYTIFSQSEECEVVLVLTHDNREISHHMTEENNEEITNTWEILSKGPNYKTLAQDVICDFIDFSNSYWPFLAPFTSKYDESRQPGNRMIKNFYKFTFAPIDIQNYSHYCHQNIIETKLVFPTKSTAILYT